MTTKIRPASDMTSASTWRFDEGSLTVYHLGEKVSLGRYATREHAARVAAAYFTEHGGRRSGAFGRYRQQSELGLGREGPSDCSRV